MLKSHFCIKLDFWRVIWKVHRLIKITLWSVTMWLDMVIFHEGILIRVPLNIVFSQCCSAWITLLKKGHQLQMWHQPMNFSQHTYMQLGRYVNKTMYVDAFTQVHLPVKQKMTSPLIFVITLRTSMRFKWYTNIYIQIVTDLKCLQGDTHRSSLVKLIIIKRSSFCDHLLD